MALFPTVGDELLSQSTHVCLPAVTSNLRPALSMCANARQAERPERYLNRIKSDSLVQSFVVEQILCTEPSI